MHDKADETIVVGDLRSANLDDDLICVRANTTFEVVETLFLLHDYSQVPVTSGKKRGASSVQKAISWKSIARAKLKNPNARPTDAFFRVQTVSATDDLIRIMPVIMDHDFVLVEDQGVLQGIVTVFDIAEFFGDKIKPFILIGEIDRRLRRTIRTNFELSEVQQICGHDGRVIDNVDDLSIGDYIAMLQPKDHWTRLGWPLDRKLVLNALNRVREERNRLMHFKEQSAIEVDLIRNALEVIRDFAPAKHKAADSSTNS